MSTTPHSTNQQDRSFFVSFIFFYILIVLSWLFFIVFHFTQYFADDSFVLAEYLMTGKQLSRSQLFSLGANNWLIAVDWLVKINMLVLSVLVSTVFLFYNILPRMKNLSVGWLIAGAISAYLPFVLTVTSFFLTGQTTISSTYVTLNKFGTLALIYPLNIAVFFYFYYLMDTFVLQKTTK